MGDTMRDPGAFDHRFSNRAQAERYRDRYKTGHRVETDRREREALRELLSGVGRLAVALDLPCGTGRLSPVLAETADRVILADSSPAMLDVAREDHPDLPADYLQTDAQNVKLSDRSVDLVFCHRFLHHIDSALLRTSILSELVRVTRRYVLLSYYPPGWRSRWRWFIRTVLGRVRAVDQLATMEQFFEETAAAGLRPVRRIPMRRFRATGVFCLFERV